MRKPKPIVKECRKCGYYRAVNDPDNLCRDCFNHAMWKGDIGPGALLRKAIKKANEGDL